MAYDQWVKISIHPVNLNVVIKNANLQWGKLHKEGNKDEEIQIDKINSTIVNGGGHFIIYSCGRQGSPSGTHGSFDIFEGVHKIGTYVWDCPWGPADVNISRWIPDGDGSVVPEDKYVVQLTGEDLSSGPLGKVYLKCAKIDLETIPAGNKF